MGRDYDVAEMAMVKWDFMLFEQALNRTTRQHDGWLASSMKFVLSCAGLAAAVLISVTPSADLGVAAVVATGDAAASVALVRVAVDHARDTGDFWVAEKLLSAAACRTGGADPQVLAALGDVQLKLRRPLEALLAWRLAAALDPRLSSGPKANRASSSSLSSSSSSSPSSPSSSSSSFLGQRLTDLEAQTSPGRWLQALELANGTAWRCDTRTITRSARGSRGGEPHAAAPGACVRFARRQRVSGLRPPHRGLSPLRAHAAAPCGTPDTSASPAPRAPPPRESLASESSPPSSSSSLSSSSLAAVSFGGIETVALFSTPLVIVNVTARRLARGEAPLSNEALVRVALQGYAEALAGGPMVDEVHGPLSPNNQFFEFQMAHFVTKSKIQQNNNFHTRCGS